MKVIVSIITLLSAGLVQCEAAPPAEVPVGTVDVSSCVDDVPPLPPEVCEAWDALYACVGASDREIDALRWLRARESECGSSLVNPRTSDIGDCQLNGVHGRPGWSFGARWSSGWAVDRFGLRSGSLAEWRANVDDAPGIARVAAACLFLLRGSDDGGAGTRDAFAGCGNWRHTGWREVCRAA